MSHDHRKQVPSYKILPLIFLLVIFINGAAGEIRCIERERKALLRFKQGLTDGNGYLSSSWGNASDCCQWNGVQCNNKTGHVTGIDLLHTGIGGNISSDLLELHHLNYLDLSWNDFGGITIPEFIGSIKSLQQLYLVHNNFSGPIPPQLGNLTNLIVLDLWYNSLVYQIPSTFVNLSSLEELYINENMFEEPLAHFFEKMSCESLSIIDISYNAFTGPIPDLGACSELRYLLFHDNPLSGTVPASLGHLLKLKYLDISFNSLQGIVSDTLFSNLINLTWLDLSLNSLTLNFSVDWIPPFSLKTIALVSCNMGPSFPAWIKTQTNITYLDISDAGIVDQVPDWLWNLSEKVTYFNLSQNQISGTIPDLSSNIFHTMDVSSNEFSGSLPLIHPNVTLARFSQNMFSGSISFICKVFSSQLVLLDLSDNRLSGELPSCWNNTRDLTFLNLNDNGFHGDIPHALGSLRSLETLQLQGNYLSGKLPLTLKNCSNLLLMDIGGNEFDGNIPPWLGEELANLTHLSLRHNSFSGVIPAEICSLTRLQMLDLSGNDLSGQIPSCFDNFTSLSDRNGSISKPISYYIDLKRSYFAYVQVQWKGKDVEYSKTLQFLKLIDLSSNGLVGNIPEAFSSLKGLISLNLSRNSLTGGIDSNIDGMVMLETLDLSNNQLSGKIPIGMVELHYLSVLNLAYNNLTGQIPVSTQLQSFNPSVYSGNNGLCGAPLAPCFDSSTATKERESDKKKDDGFMSMLEFYISLPLGFIFGFWGFVGSLVFSRSWRKAYFGFIDISLGNWL